jgi:hypothetical protein
VGSGFPTDKGDNAVPGDCQTPDQIRDLSQAPSNGLVVVLKSYLLIFTTVRYSSTRITCLQRGIEGRHHH